MEDANTQWNEHQVCKCNGQATIPIPSSTRFILLFARCHILGALPDCVLWACDAMRPPSHLRRLGVLSGVRHPQKVKNHWAWSLHWHGSFYSQGLIDLDKEIAKLKAKRADQTKKLAALKEKMSKPAYQSKVPEAVRLSDAEKVLFFLPPRCRVACSSETLWSSEGEAVEFGNWSFFF